MASTTSPPSTFLSSPRSQRLLLWISGAVLVIGIGIFLGVFFSRGTAQPVSSDLSTISTPPDPATRPAPHVKPSPAALGVARTFLETAVAQKHLHVAYGLVGPALKEGLSFAQWRKGNPVQPFQAKNLKTAGLTVKSSTKNDLWLEVGPLVPARGADVDKSVKSLAFDMEVARLGGKWRVNYWLAVYGIPHLPTPTN